MQQNLVSVHLLNATPRLENFASDKPFLKLLAIGRKIFYKLRIWKYILLYFQNNAFGLISKKTWLNPMSQRFFPHDFLCDFIVLRFPFRSLFHFKLIFVCGTRFGLRFILLQMHIHSIKKTAIFLLIYYGTHVGIRYSCVAILVDSLSINLIVYGSSAMLFWLLYSLTISPEIRQY